MGRPETSLPRVLVVAHNPFSDTQNNGKTLTGFFAGWPEDRLAQIYLTLDEPSFSTCRTFYRVTDLDILKTLGRRTSGAGPVHPSGWSDDARTKASLGRNPAYRLVRKVFLARPPTAMLLRSAAWHLGLRRDVALGEWIDDFAPDLVFFQSSSATFAFDLVESICAERDIPLIMSTTDDYVTPRTTWSLASRLHYRRMQQRYRAAVRRSYAVIAIGQKMATEYAARFGGRFEVAMNSVPLMDSVPPEPLAPDRPLVLHFAGNLGLNRWRVLASVGQALTDLHANGGVDSVLEIYSINAPEPAQLRALTTSSRVRLCGAVDTETLREHRARADVLVHVESFDAHNKHVTRLSVSTKIPEYMSADRTILAIGPADVASIGYVADNQAGVVVTEDSPRLIAEALETLVEDPGLGARMRASALALAHANHSRDQTRQMIADLVVEAARSVDGASPSR